MWQKQWRKLRQLKTNAQRESCELSLIWGSEDATPGGSISDRSETLLQEAGEDQYVGDFGEGVSPCRQAHMVQKVRTTTKTDLKSQNFTPKYRKERNNQEWRRGN